MPVRPMRWNCRSILVLFMLLWSAAVASAEWYKDYEAALDFVKKGRWADAIPRFQTAIQQKNQEGLNIKFYGMKFDDYLPHYYLGKAYFSQNKYEEALDQFQISLSQGEIQRNRNYFQNLTELQTLAKAEINKHPTQVPEEKPKPVTPEPKPATQELKPVTKELKPEPSEQKKPEPQLAIRETPAPPKKEPEASPKETEPVIPNPAPSPEELNREKAKSLIKDGARKYFQGDFDSAIASFSSALHVSPQEFSARFLLGCSYAAKYLLSGSSDRDSYDKAAEAFQQSHKLNPDHPLTKSDLISPAVREIYAKTSGA